MHTTVAPYEWNNVSLSTLIYKIDFSITAQPFPQKHMPVKSGPWGQEDFGSQGYYSLRSIIPLDSCPQ